MSSIGQLIDDVELSVKSMEELHSNIEDVDNLTEEEESRVVLREKRNEVSTALSQGVAKDSSTEILHLLNDDASRVTNEDIEESNVSDDDDSNDGTPNYNVTDESTKVSKDATAVVSATDKVAKLVLKVGDNRKVDKTILANLGYNRFMIEDAYKIGCLRLLKANLENTRLHAQARVKRRQEGNKYVVEEVRKGNVKSNTNLQEDSNYEMPSWKNFLMTKYPDFYD